VIETDHIIQECRQYNKFAQRMLYEMYAPKMKGVCMRYVNDNETLKDILQEGFIKVFSNIRQYKGNGSFEGWMKRVFINTAISHIRKNNKKDHLNIEEIDQSILLDDTTESSSTENLNINSGPINAELIQLAELTEKELLNALLKIPEKFRIVFNLYCIENMKHEEIADILNIDIATSRTRLLRARNSVKKELFSICLEKLNQ